MPCIIFLGIHCFDQLSYLFAALSNILLKQPMEEKSIMVWWNVYSQYWYIYRVISQKHWQALLKIRLGILMTIYWHSLVSKIQLWKLIVNPNSFQSIALWFFSLSVIWAGIWSSGSIQMLLPRFTHWPNCEWTLDTQMWLDSSFLQLVLLHCPFSHRKIWWICASLIILTLYVRATHK